MDGVACGQKSEKIYLENLREYFSIVFVDSALFSQYNRFLDCEKRRKRQNWTKMARCASGVEGGLRPEIWENLF